MLRRRTTAGDNFLTSYTQNYCNIINKLGTLTLKASARFFARRKKTLACRSCKLLIVARRSVAAAEKCLTLKLSKELLEIFDKIQASMEVYGKERMSRTRVFEWHKQFCEGRTDVEDDKRSRHPSISKTTKNIREIEKIVREDCRLSIRLIAERMSIDKETVWQVLHDNLHMTKVCAQVVSKLSTSDQKEKNAKRFALTF